MSLRMREINGINFARLHGDLAILEKHVEHGNIALHRQQRHGILSEIERKVRMSEGSDG